MNIRKSNVERKLRSDSIVKLKSKYSGLTRIHKSSYYRMHIQDEIPENSLRIVQLEWNSKYW